MEEERAHNELAKGLNKSTLLDSYLSELCRYSGLSKEGLCAELAPRLSHLKTEPSLEDLRQAVAEMVQETLLKLKESISRDPEI